MTFTIWLLCAVAWLLCVVATACVAVRRPRNVGVWVLLGVLLGPIALIAVLCLLAVLLARRRGLYQGGQLLSDYKPEKGGKHG